MKRLNPKEEQIMQILWQLENAFMKDMRPLVEPIAIMLPLKRRHIEILLLSD